ncbi:hypothetical protein GBB84_09810 [Citrobacter sp. NMI7905_11]|uniref:Uncharacterized protein n=1 Tax=Citrobacter telavivensis TaxID=2653932 RepID=A0A6L5E944_9ENTR|nr:hypothetical protein [Citrobacter telavivensis]
MPDGAVLIRPTKQEYSCRPDKVLAPPSATHCLMALRLSGLQSRNTVVGRIRCLHRHPAERP